MADVERERVTALWREAAAGLDEISARARAEQPCAECGRLREQLDAARQALDLVDAPYPLDVFPERTPEQRDAIFAAMRAVDPHATEWFYAHVARERGRVARAALGVVGEPEDAAKKSVTQGGIGDTAGFFLPPGVEGEQEKPT